MSEEDQNIKVIIKCSDMPEKLQIDSISLGIEAYYNHISSLNEREKSQSAADVFTKIASDIQKVFQKKYSNYWHVVVGDNFGSFVTHESKSFVFFEIEGMSVLIFKTA